MPRALFFGIVPAMLILSMPAIDNALGGRQTWVLSAETYGADIRFRGKGNAWPLVAPTLCIPRAKPARSGSADGRCDPRRFTEETPETLLINWPAGAEASLLKTESELQIILTTGAGDYPAGTLILLAADDLDALGTLGFTGTLSVGRVMSTGARGYLQTGTYSVRESGYISALLGAHTNTVSDGALTRGDVAAIVTLDETEEPADGFGHLTPRLSGGGPLDLVFLSTNRAAALQINAFGQEQAILIRPNWLDRALTNPYLVFLALFASLTGSIVQMVEGIRRVSSKEPDET